MDDKIFKEIREQLAPDEALIRKVLVEDYVVRTDRRRSLRAVLSAAAACAVTVCICAAFVGKIYAPSQSGSSPVLNVNTSDMLQAESVADTVPSQTQPDVGSGSAELVLSQALSEAVADPSINEYDICVELKNADDVYSEYFKTMTYDGKTVEELKAEYEKVRTFLNTAYASSMPMVYSYYNEMCNKLDAKLNEIYASQVEYAYTAQTKYFGTIGINAEYKDGKIYAAVTTEQLEQLQLFYDGECIYYVSLADEK